MRKKTFILALALMLALVFVGCNAQNQEPKSDVQGPTDEALEVNISAAASLTGALTEIKEEYAKESNAVLQFNFTASGALQKQIEEGAPADLFISASQAHMDALEEQGLIDSDSRKDMLGNSLTLIVASEKADSLTMENVFTDAESISIGTPESVPAGKYAQESLESLDVWEEIQPKLVFAKDVRQVLEYVDTGNVDCGLVYKSDAMMLKTGKIIGDMPEDSHEPILYPLALMKESAEPEAAAAFYEFLQTEYAKGVFEKYGFVVQ